MPHERVHEAPTESLAGAYPEFIALGRMGPYRLHEVLGEGGMGIVFRATHQHSDEEIALKTVNRVTRRRMLALREEILALCAAPHPGLVRILDQGNHEGIPWYAMELLTGKTLAHYNDGLWDDGLDVTVSGVSRTAWPAAPADGSGASPKDFRVLSPQTAVAGGALDSALRLYRDICEPLAHIHARGMVHRDLKPQNVFIRTDERPVLMDFGLIGYASGAVGREVLEAGNQGFGTVHYVSPERVEGRHVDTRADLYSIGCMLYETLVGRPPFVGEAAYVLSQHLSAEPLPPSKILDGVPGEVEALILRLLAKAPHQRIGHAQDVAEALSKALRAGPAYAVRTDQVPLFRPQLSGREEVLSVLSQSLDAACDKRGGMVLVGGESGIGKTFLTSELAHAAVRRGLRVVTGGATQFSPDPVKGRSDSVAPLQALRSLLQTIADSCREYGPAERERILGRHALYLAPFEPSLEAFVGIDAKSAPDTLPGAASMERVKSALAETLRAYASGKPLLIVVDDVQWADKLSTSFLAELEQTFFVGLPLLIVCAYRSDQAQPALNALLANGACTSILLRRLEQSAVQRMVADMLSSEPPPELATFLTRESEGNPFFVAEYLRYLVAGSYLVRVDGKWLLRHEKSGKTTDYGGIRMPDRLEQLLNWRLEALSEPARHLMQAAAVLGKTFSLEVLTKLAGTSDERVLELLQEARGRQVLESLAPNAYRFYHDKLREATYASLTVDAKRELHARAARAIEATDTGEGSASRARDLALHYDLGGEPAHALPNFVRAGEEALKKAALHEAIELLQAALRVHAQTARVEPSEEARWHRLLGGALHDIGDFGAGNRHLKLAIQLLGERAPSDSRPSLVAAVGLEFFKQARARLWPSAARIDSEQERIILQRAKVHDRLQQAAYYTDDALPMLYSCMRMLNLAERAPPSPTLTIAYANATAVAGVLPSRRLAGLYETLARGSMRAAPSAVSLAHLCLIGAGYATGIGAWQRALELLKEGLAASESVDFAQRARQTCAATSSACFLMGDYAEALLTATRLEDQSKGKDAHTHCWALLLIAQVELVQGNLLASEEHLRRTEPLLRTLGRPERIWSGGLQAFVSAKLGDAGAAENASRRVLKDIIGAPLMNYFTVDAVARCAEVWLWLAAADGGSAEKRRCARQATQALRSMKRAFPIAEPRLNLLNGIWHRQQGNTDAAGRKFRAGKAAAKKLHMPYEELRALLALSEMQPEAQQSASMLVKSLRVAEASARPF